MNWFDWTVIAVVSLSTLLSLLRGFTREALSLLSWVAAFFVSISFAARLAAQLGAHIASDGWRYAVAYVLLFVATLLLSALLNALLAQLLRITGLGGVDRVLGTAFGFARGVIVILVALFVVRAIVPATAMQAIEQSLLMPHLALIEEWARQNFSDVAQQVRT